MLVIARSVRRSLAALLLSLCFVTLSASGTCDDRELTANVVCAEFARPRIAFVFAGAVRTLAQPLVYRTIRTNLIEAMGGDATVFALLKKYDIRWDPHGDTIKASTPASVASALRHLGVHPRNILMQNATGSNLGSCPGYPPYDSTARGQLASLVGQLDSRRKAYEMILAEEGRAGQRYTHVVYTRPGTFLYTANCIAISTTATATATIRAAIDLSWPIPVRPYCFWDLARAVRKHDWVWMLPREPDARLALRELPEAFFTCKRGGTQIEGFMFAGYVGIESTCVPTY